MDSRTSLDGNAALWQKAFKLEYLLLNLIDMNKRHKKATQRKIRLLARLLNHEGFSASLISQHLHKPPQSIVDTKPEEEIAAERKPKDKEETESDHELNKASGLEEEEVRVMSVGRIKLNVPKVLKDQGIPTDHVSGQWNKQTSKYQ
eukprot:TRINITY_DN8162_c0_g1_i15.p1 TRINITY_DN8162_c0_g1~~TRINITY_DN8162_c0_g1_i15.p1  ORF type:complete len:147 (-),score=58.54 TRINITY_DN8162_c0_g1_i15:147-587(-)